MSATLPYTHLTSLRQLVLSAGLARAPGAQLGPCRAVALPRAAPAAQLPAARRRAATGPSQYRRSLAAAAAADDAPPAPPPPAAAAPPQPPAAPGPSRAAIAGLVASVAVVVVTGIGNRLLYKMALKPLGNYVFFLAQTQTFLYCAVYFAVLAVRYRSGAVSREMLAVPRRMASTFVAIGFVEAASSLLTFIAAAQLPGVVLPLLSQTVLFWQVALALTVLRKRLSSAQMAGVVAVVAGVALAAWPSTGGHILDGVSPVYAAVFVVAMLFPALDTILKESVFRRWREEWAPGVAGEAGKGSGATHQQRGRDLDLFVLNSFGSAAQAVFVFALLPVITAARGMALGDLPGYLDAGWACFRGLTPPCGSDCSGAPVLPLAYILFNLAFNVAALRVIRQAGNVAISLVMSSIVPLTLFAFTLPLPYLDPAPPLGVNFFLGTGLLMVGLGAYNAPMWAPALGRYLQAMRERSRAEWGDAGGGPAERGAWVRGRAFFFEHTLNK